MTSRGTFSRICGTLSKGMCVMLWSISSEVFKLPRALTSTTLTLVPKVNNPENLDDMRPISLCNFSYKIIAKILQTRFAKTLPKCIVENQAGFVSNRSIHENVVVAIELAHDIDKKVRGGNLMLKLDSKAYDKASSSFLIQVMRRKGFS